MLPGVTVEAASPALIEKVRTATTDSSGQYRIIDLRPGTYTVTFTLAGFNTVRRDGVTLAGTAASQVDAELRQPARVRQVQRLGQAKARNVGHRRFAATDKVGADDHCNSRGFSASAWPKMSASVSGQCAASIMSYCASENSQRSTRRTSA